ncbi:MAG: hypothetical protein WC763_05675 [Candidatus Paceibacterota bacterium]|jgi:hypothetical protein
MTTATGIAMRLDDDDEEGFRGQIPLAENGDEASSSPSPLQLAADEKRRTDEAVKMLIVYSLDNSQSTKIDPVRAVCSMAQVLGVEECFFVVRSPLAEKSKKTVSSQFPEIKTHYWLEQDLLYHWFGNVYVNPMAAVKRTDSISIGIAGDSAHKGDNLGPCMTPVFWQCKESHTRAIGDVWMLQTWSNLFDMLYRQGNYAEPTPPPESCPCTHEACQEAGYNAIYAKLVRDSPALTPERQSKLFNSFRSLKGVIAFAALIQLEGPTRIKRTATGAEAETHHPSGLSQPQLNLLGDYVSSASNLVGLLPGNAIAQRFDMRVGDLLHSQRFLPKATRVIRIVTDRKSDNAALDAVTTAATTTATLSSAAE